MYRGVDTRTCSEVGGRKALSNCSSRGVLLEAMWACPPANRIRSGTCMSSRGSRRAMPRSLSLPVWPVEPELNPLAVLWVGLDSPDMTMRSGTRMRVEISAVKRASLYRSAAEGPDGSDMNAQNQKTRLEDKRDQQTMSSDQPTWNRPKPGPKAMGASTTSPPLDPAVQAWFEDLFTQLDSNRDGRIDPNELAEGLHSLGYGHVSKKEMEEFLIKSDTSQSGDLDKGEFVRYMTNHERHLRLQFAKLDENQDGVVEVKI
eukprot:TCALIF_07963-PA protein Name:"Similar to slc25a24-b Calcium-binding mitochondrial carrier protein SCaMC-1-B (Xenopus laevis)" AED:0.90 eAED:0.90 QI:0/0/0/0.2/1/1/5/0/258